VQRAVASQDLSPGDVDRLAARKAGLREEHATLQAQVQVAHRGGAEAEASLKKSLAEVRSAARAGAVLRLRATSAREQVYRCLFVC
jgi:hypothetical protein